jgi:two-component system, OmpR family, phosphate regulon sensor histidine kinase PhoR
MWWPWITLLALGGLAALHFLWRGRFLAGQATLQRELERLRLDQQQASQQFQAREDALFNSMSEGLVVLDEDRRIRLANRAFLDLFGVSSDVRSRTLLEALRLHELVKLVEEIGVRRRVEGYELKLTHPEDRVLQVNGSVIAAEDEKPQGTILVFHDLTRLKALERTRQEFVANVSHELRTPLSLIQGYVETLLEGAKDNPEVSTRFLQTIQRNSERLKLLIEDLLVISELESGLLKLDLQPVALRGIADKVLGDFQDRAASRQVTLINEVPELCVRADPGRLEQVLGNLIDNAIKYGRSEGRVTVGARVVDGGQAEISVQDDGPGIPAEALERVFERFYRVDKARSREQGGTGLGLAIVKHIVQNHGGKIWARNSPNSGACFSFTLLLAG